MDILKNISLQEYNTFGIDVSAGMFAACHSEEDLKEVLADKTLKNTPKFVLGGGSNLLFTKDFSGLVIHIRLKGIEVIEENISSYLVKAAAGEVWHNLVEYCIGKNFGGMENLSLIPGCVGASPMQNIGAYGVEIKDVFESLDALHIKENVSYTFTAKDCKFGYRESIFKRELKDQFIITSVTFRLSKYHKINTSYGAISQELENMKIINPGISDVSKAVIKIRTSKLPDPKQIGNAGSFFKNPEIGAEHFARLKLIFPEIVGYKLENDRVKVAAGWLIESCGWKGKRFGDAGVHKLQALVLVNYGSASGREILHLSTQIMESVKDKFDIDLEREVNIM